MYLPAGAGIVPDGGRGGRANTSGAPNTIIVCLHASGSVRDVMKEISAEVRGNFSGDVQLALSGHSG